VRGPGALFLPSFPTAEPGPLRDTAFLYDNALATIALVACGHKARAAQIGDAILFALDHDRYWHDGRLRNAYLAGPANSDPVKLSGWWDAAQNKWVEDAYQAGSDTGNMAWAMLALLTIHDATQAPQYRAGAQRIAAYVETTLSKVRPAGFDGGVFGFEPSPVRDSWKSTEHNTDLAAAFVRLAQASGDARWRKRARQARGFALAMWRPKCRCFAAGTAADGHTRNILMALDAQVWPLLAIPGAVKHDAGVLATINSRLRAGDGYSYGEGGQGVWTEGTAQVALLLSLLGRSGEASVLTAAIDHNRAPDGWYYATDAASLTTGLDLESDPAQPRAYFHLPHLAALAWAALAEQRFNPFTGNRSLASGTAAP
jgi:hypothetical protein